MMMIMMMIGSFQPPKLEQDPNEPLNSLDL